MANLSKIIDELSKLTVVEAADLSKKLEKKWGVTAVSPVAAAPVAGSVAPAEEKTDFVIFRIYCSPSEKSASWEKSKREKPIDGIPSKAPSTAADMVPE